MTPVIGRSTVSYAGPPRWQLPELIARKREEHAGHLRRARIAWRVYGAHGLAARYLDYAALSRLQLRQLLANRRALETVWRECTWMDYEEYREATK